MKYDKLIIVESPAKAKTISKFIDGAVVLASKGHIRDLPKFYTGIKIEGDKFTPVYEIPKDHKDIVAEIKEEAKDKKVYLASDEDREGEAIGYHIASILGGDPLSYDRIVFHEITEGAIKHALEHPRKLNLDAVAAQEARRMLDRLVGFKLSPLVSNKVLPKLSAGRVQSAVLKLVADREHEIKEFKPVTYYELPITIEKDIPAVLVQHKDLKITKQCIQDLELANSIKSSIESDSFKVTDVASKKTTSKPQPPFKTTTLQQTASTELGYDPSKTMSIAQKLYEGVDTPNGRKGAITYMRTDSLNLATVAVDSIRKQILDMYGKEYLNDTARVYENKTKGAQEAHEAIRVTDITFTPEVAKKWLDPDYLKLYTLIWNRTMMCQMSDSTMENMNMVVTGKDNIVNIKGRKVLFDGWTKLRSKATEDVILPDIAIGSAVKIQEVKIDAKQTEPPARYNAASLVKTMEDLGIGRPSTYAATIKLLLDRRYVRTEGKAMFLTETGEKLNDFLVKYFLDIVDDKFTSDMESKLDSIATGHTTRDKVLAEYVLPLLDKVKQYYTDLPSLKPAPIPTGEKCPKCGGELYIREGKYGSFKGCSNYPKCKYIEKEQLPVDPNELKENGNCPICGKALVKHRGRFGFFYGCTGYPDCKFMSNLPVAEEKCKVCGGWMKVKTDKDGNKFNICPTCNPPKKITKKK